MAKFTDKDIFPETRDLIVQQTSFDSMKNSEHTNFSWFEGIKSDGFTRKGLVGQWKNVFTEEKKEFCKKKKRWTEQGMNLTLEKLTIT